MRSLDMGGEQHEASQEKLQLQEETDKTKSDLAASLSENKDSVETSTNMLCGVGYESLSDSQKQLFDKLTPQQREDLSSVVSIDKAQGSINFLMLNMAIMDKDTATYVTKYKANEVIKELGGGWQLPGDVYYDDSNRQTLNSEESDYDAMILQMPGKSDKERYVNFVLITGMKGNYWTSQTHNKPGLTLRYPQASKYVIREFYENYWDRERYNGGSDNVNVRVVKPL